MGGNKKNGSTAKLGAGVVAILAAFGVVVVGGRMTGATVTVGAPTKVDTAAVVTASHDLTPGTQIKASDLASTPFLPATVPKNAYVDPANVVGKWVTSTVSKGVPVSGDSLSTSKGGLPLNAAGGDGIAGPALGVPAGEVALAIPTSGVNIATAGSAQAATAVTNVGNYVEAGNHIDILGDPGNGQTSYLFQDILVLKVGSAGSTQSPAAGAATAPVSTDVLVVLMTRDQAEQMTYLLNSKDTRSLKYALRGKDDSGKGNLASTPNPRPQQDPTVGSGSFN